MPVFQFAVTAATGLLYTIPSLAAFTLLIPITGLTLLTAVIPLTTYTLLILYLNTVAGLRSVPPEVNEAADAMGYRGWTRFWRVQLPLATPLIMSGVRVAAVTTVTPPRTATGAVSTMPPPDTLTALPVVVRNDTRARCPAETPSPSEMR